MLSKFYSQINNLELETTCPQVTLEKWEELMKWAKRANKRIINNLVKKFIPELYKWLNLDLHNPYGYFRTKIHLILVHSAIEYFILINK